MAPSASAGHPGKEQAFRFAATGGRPAAGRTHCGGSRLRTPGGLRIRSGRGTGHRSGRPRQHQNGPVTRHSGDRQHRSGREIHRSGRLGRRNGRGTGRRSDSRPPSRPACPARADQLRQRRNGQRQGGRSHPASAGCHHSQRLGRRRHDRRRRVSQPIRPCRDHRRQERPARLDARGSRRGPIRTQPCSSSCSCDMKKGQPVRHKPNGLAAKTTKVVRQCRTTLVESVSGDVLLSHAVARAVPSALRGLASGFGMGPGVSLSLWSPKLYGDIPVRTVMSTSSDGDRTSGTAQWTRSIFVANPRPISTSQLQTLLFFHFWPINPVV